MISHAMIAMSLGMSPAQPANLRTISATSAAQETTIQVPRSYVCGQACYFDLACLIYQSLWCRNDIDG